MCTRVKINSDPNAGRINNTPWNAGQRPKTRKFSVEISDGEFLRDKKGRVRRFSSRTSAVEAAIKAGYKVK